MNISYGNGEVRLDAKTINVKAFDIRYKGRMTAESELPSSWTIINSDNNNRIIGFSLGDFQPELLFTYEGNLMIISCDIADAENMYPVAPSRLRLDYWKDLYTKFEDFTQPPEDAKETIAKGRIPKSTTMKQINLQTEQDEWFLEDGTSYYGEYHTHGDGLSMTGSKHTKESKNIFRKDVKGNIFKLKTSRPRRTRTTRRARTTTRTTGGGGY